MHGLAEGIAHLQQTDNLVGEGLDHGDFEPKPEILHFGAERSAFIEQELGAERASPPLLQCLHALAVRTELLLDDSKSLSAEIRDVRLGCEVSVIQAFADKIVQLLKARDPLSERVHLGPLELLGHSLGGIVSELARRASGRRPLSTPAAGA